MTKLNFPPPASTRPRRPAVNVNDLVDRDLTFGQRSADVVARVVGSWRFIAIASSFYVLWVVLNVVAWVHHWDVYPFILLNLMLSFQAAYTAPIIMMSQNRQDARDRLVSHNDYAVDLKAEREIRMLQEHLEAQNEAIAAIYELLTDVQQQISNFAQR